MTTHPTIEDLLEKLQVARRARGEARAPGGPEPLRLYRELVAACPAFTPALLDLGRLLQLVDEPGVEDARAFAEIQRLLEQAVRASNREAAPLVELGYFLDTVRQTPQEAFALYEEGAARAQQVLEEAWAGMLRFWKHERTKESLEKALRLGELAEKVFPGSSRIQGAVHEVRQCAVSDGLLPPESP
jgi:hypothetical protein